MWHTNEMGGRSNYRITMLHYTCIIYLYKNCGIILTLISRERIFGLLILLWIHISINNLFAIY